MAGADKISGAMEEQSKERDRVEPDKETRLSDVAKKTVNGGAEARDKAASITRIVGKAVSGAAFEVGEWVGEKTVG